MKITSYNCNSVRNNSEIVKSLFVDTDILLLQELMLEKRDLGFLNDFNGNFKHIAYVHDRESENICEGRPSRGVAIFWRESLSSMISPVMVNDFMIGVILKFKCFNVLLLNVYLPCDLQTIESLENYRQSLAMLEVVINEQNVNQVLIMGDCNADPSKGRFWELLNNFTRSLSLHVLNEHFPCDTFTYLCPSKNTTSWLDHVICTSKLIDKIGNAFVDYNTALFDHFPVSIVLNVPNYTKCCINSERMICEFVNWNKITDGDREIIKEFINNEIIKNGLFDYYALSCCNPNCVNKQHRDNLTNVFDSVKCILYQSTERFRYANERRFKIIPGWNDHVKHFHDIARKSFLLWKDKGRPLQGRLLESMKQTRASFRNALKYCKTNEVNIRNEKLLENLRLKDYAGFWKGVAKINNHNTPYPTEIDSKSDNDDICALFSNKYEQIFNRNTIYKDFVKSNITNKEKVEILLRFTIADVKKSIKLLKDTVGFDNIHSNHLKFNSEVLDDLLARLFTSFIIHGFVPRDMIKGIITPVVKDKFGDLSDSGNYRPIMNSSVFLKCFEYCLLDKINPYVKLNDRQHGFRKCYSTSTACYCLKETVLYYTQARSVVYACFVDVKKAFDSVSHDILLDKLHHIGIPDSIVNIIRFWYSNQFTQVKYQNSLSNEWKLSNGVRQGGVLSGILFCIYIDSLIDKISKMKVGCKLELIRSNIIAYADDIVLLAPSREALQLLLSEAHLQASNLKLDFNYEKTKIMRFSHGSSKAENLQIKSLIIGNQPIQAVTTIRYLGYMINNNLSNSDDISRAKSKFYSEFNLILRKFSFADKEVKLFLFKQYCLQFYGSELWFGPCKSAQALKQFGVGYHKAIKKLLGLSTHESNHFACQEARLLMFGHLLNKQKICTVLRFILKPCDFIRKLINFMVLSSVMIRDVTCILKRDYGIDALFHNDIDAIMSRIQYVQNHEHQMRVSW